MPDEDLTGAFSFVAFLANTPFSHHRLSGEAGKTKDLIATEILHGSRNTWTTAQKSIDNKAFILLCFVASFSPFLSVKSLPVRTLASDRS